MAILQAAYSVWRHVWKGLLDLGSWGWVSDTSQHPCACRNYYRPCWTSQSRWRLRITSQNNYKNYNVVQYIAGNAIAQIFKTYFSLHILTNASFCIFYFLFIAEADFQLVYYPEDSSASSFGAAAGVLWGLGSAVSAVGAVAGVVPATTLLRGVHYAQSFYWLGQLAIQNMPVNYQSASRQLRFITLDYK